ncbi:hypothetical protein RCL_jg3959.t1 [Rhizophagus clarus]|uniref:Uncharacterized protein n=1 Tax=Rhizophagus clarus TaxID=94130 RepID=A0A8H3KRF2_9GLOM|nr:hypothetical protein RCL_jg3959.t1 [Rhizophagus clarus]
MISSDLKRPMILQTSKRSVYWIFEGGFSKGLKVSDFWVNGKVNLMLNSTFDLCDSGFDWLWVVSFEL